MSGSRRILVVGNFLSSIGGHRQYCEDFADKLSHRGNDIVRTSKVEGRLHRLVDMLATAWFRRGYYDVAQVSVFSGKAFAWAEAVAFELRRLGKPYVLTLHGGNLPEFAKEWPTRLRRLLVSAKAVTAPSRFLQENLRSLAPDIRVLPNAIDVSRYPFALRANVRPHLVWLRALHGIYNPVLAVDVLARLLSRYPDATLRMIGPDRDGTLAHVERRATELGVASRLTIVGGVPRSRVPQELAVGDVFINTTDVDNAPVSVLEALACGLCVVSTSVGGIPFLVRDQDTALLVPPRDADAMAAAVARCVETPSLARSLSMRGQQLAATHDWNAVLGEWESLFDEVFGHV